MNKSFQSYRELVADALSPKPFGSNLDALIVTNLQFQPSLAALQRADEIRKRLRAERAEAVAG